MSNITFNLGTRIYEEATNYYFCTNIFHNEY